MVPKKLPLDLFNLSLGYTLSAGFIFCFLLGLYIDHKRGQGHIGIIGGILIGLCYGGYEIWKVLRNLEK